MCTGRPESIRKRGREEKKNGGKIPMVVDELMLGKGEWTEETNTVKIPGGEKANQ